MRILIELIRIFQTLHNFPFYLSVPVMDLFFLGRISVYFKDGADVGREVHLYVYFENVFKRSKAYKRSGVGER